MTQTRWVPPSTPEPPGIQTIPYRGLRSRCTTPGFAAPDRLDPYFHGMWVDGAQASWMSQALLDRLRKTKLAKTSAADRKAARRDQVAAILRTRRQAHLSELAAVAMWRTLTGQQLAALTGHPGAAINPREMAAAFRAGLIDRGTLLSDLKVGGIDGAPFEHHLYRPVDTPAIKDLLASLTYEELMGLTAGQPWTRGAQNDRHNLLATELGLRAAEYCDIGTVVGERLSRVGMLTRNDVTPTGPVADLCIVRDDGHRIAVEITASVNPAFSAKAARWAKALAAMDNDDVGCSVLFVEAGGPERPASTSMNIWNSMRSAVAQAAYENGGARAGVPERMAIARWRWWFPEPGSTSSAFQVLECLRPTGPWNNRWEVVALLDPTDLVFEPPHRELSMGLIHNSWDLSGLPHWLKPKGHRTDFKQALMRRFGLTEIPRIAPTR